MSQGITAFPGILAGDMPLLNVAGGMITTGRVFFADSNTGNASASGRTPDRARNSIQNCMTLCRANKGDVIFAMPGHVETISAAGSLTFSKAGVRVFGIGVGLNRPILNFTATAGTVEMDSANCRLSNVILRADISAVVVGINVDAANCEIDHCYSTYVDTGDDFVVLIDPASVAGAYIHDNYFTTEITAGADSVVKMTASDFIRIHDNEFHGQWAKAPIVGETTLSLNVSILRNTVFNADTSVYNGIDMGALSSTGIITDNRVTALYATAVAKIFRDGTTTYHNNTWVNAVSERGIPLGTTPT